MIKRYNNFKLQVYTYYEKVFFVREGFTLYIKNLEQEYDTL